MCRNVTKKNMLDDAELFSELCQKHGILVEPEIVEAVTASCTTGELRLAHSSIIASLCEIVAQVLSSSSTIKVVDFSDCMLLPKGVSCILKALSEGSSVTALYLKGNNISGPLVEQLGDMLLHNNTLKIMHIEWNNLGAQIESFSKFCNGLAKNHYIEELDLRYNQISTMCADHLAMALKSNKSLKNFDLSWNSLGMTGGQKILQGIQHNRSLVMLNLKGNCIPSEIHSEIKDFIVENQNRKILCESQIQLKENVQPVSATSDEDDKVSEVKHRVRRKKKKRERSKTPIEELRDSPLGNSCNDEDNTLETRKKLGSNSHNNSLEFDDKISALNQILQDRLASIDAMKDELETKNTEIKLVKAENGELKTEIERLKESNKDVIEEKSKEIENMKKTLAKAENNWKESYKELEETHQNVLKSKQELDAKNRSYEKDLRKASLEMQSIKEKFTSTVQSYEDTISECKVEVHRVRREMHERENRCKIEINTLKDTLKETTEALEKCQEHLKMLRNQLHESIDAEAKLKMKAEEAERFVARTVKIEESLIKSKDEREKLEDKLQDSRKTIAMLQKQIIKLQEESIEPQKRYEALKLELQIEREKTASLKTEIQDERARMREQNEQLQKMLSQINGLYSKINETQINHAEALRAKDAEIEKLKNGIAQKSKELDEFKSEQVQRAHQFQAAISKYFGNNS